MKRKAEEDDEAEQSRWNHGVKWLRGKMIGKGGFGSVFLATLKNPRSKFSCFPSVMAVKSAEVSVSATLQKEREVLNNVQDCPFVIKCFGEEITTSEKGEMVFNLLLEFASGGTLADQIKKSGGQGLPECDVKRYTKSILRGLYHIHGRGFVHCDLKPKNILMVPRPNSAASSGGDDFVAKIGDFGLAKRNSQSKKKKLDPYLRGTAMYMAPEALINYVQEPVSDIWALGCVVLEMLTGKAPWQRSPDLNTDDLLRLIRDGSELPKIPSELSKEAREFLKGCFVRKTIYRLTAEMLLCHPFLDGTDDDHDGEDKGVENVMEFPLLDNDDELSSSFSDDWESTSEDVLYSCSWSDEDDFEEMEVPLDESSAEKGILGSEESNRISSGGGERVFGSMKPASTIPTRS